MTELHGSPHLLLVSEIQTVPDEGRAHAVTLPRHAFGRVLAPSRGGGAHSEVNQTFYSRLESGAVARSDPALQFRTTGTGYQDQSAQERLRTGGRCEIRTGSGGRG